IAVRVHQRNRLEVFPVEVEHLDLAPPVSDQELTVRIEAKCAEVGEWLGMLGSVYPINSEQESPVGRELADHVGRFIGCPNVAVRIDRHSDQETKYLNRRARPAPTCEEFSVRGEFLDTLVSCFGDVKTPI